MTALTKAIIATVISFFGSLSQVEPEVKTNFITEINYDKTSINCSNKHPENCFYVLNNECFKLKRD